MFLYFSLNVQPPRPLQASTKINSQEKTYIEIKRIWLIATNKK